MSERMGGEKGLSELPEGNRVVGRLLMEVSRA